MNKNNKVNVIAVSLAGVLTVTNIITLGLLINNKHSKSAQSVTPPSHNHCNDPKHVNVIHGVGDTCICCHRNSNEIEGKNEIIGHFQCGSAICKQCLVTLSTRTQDLTYKEHIFSKEHRFVCPACQAPECDITYYCEYCNDCVIHITKNRNQHLQKKHGTICQNCGEPITGSVVEGEDVEGNKISGCEKCFFECPICFMVFSTKKSILNYQCADDPKNTNATPHYLCSGCAQAFKGTQCPLCKAESKQY